MVQRGTDRILDEVRGGKLREIGPRVARLSAAQRRAVSREVCRQLDEVVSRKALSPEHRWLVTALQYLAPREAGELAARTVREAARLKGCCGCTLNRSIRALGAIRPAEGIPALVDVIHGAEHPRHKHLAAACIAKIVKSGGSAAEEGLAKERGRLARALKRLEKEVAAAEPVTPARPWEQPAGSPGWYAAAERAVRGIGRVIGAAAS
jgi:hypothetical protein